MKNTTASIAIATALISHAATAEIVAEHYTAQLDVPYAKGLVTVDGELTERDLVMDIIQPNTPKAEHNPVVVMTFGGNFIRGGRDDIYSVSGAQTTTMRDYCEQFAQVGYTCVAIDYRLSREEPVPTNIGYSDKMLVDQELRSKALHDRHNLLRVNKGLEPIPYGSDILRNSIIAAAEDLYQAIGYLQNNAETLGIDPDRIALGGFSAGAITSFNVAYGMNAPVKAVMANSGMLLGFDLNPQNQTELPPAIIHFGQYDLDALFDVAEHSLPKYSQAGIHVDTAWVAGFGHFYPSGAITLDDNVTRAPLIERMVSFLDKSL
ncbi:alpha/beta hydrolase [Vibrio sp. WXL103]|uniref:alpha/beta hydrolase n=1 Tax=Vibrio sp. WXL103 TaxID=3450710 RepID=UPI003EC7AC65